MLPNRICRRDVLKTAGIAVVGGTVASGAASADEPQQPGPIHNEPTWGSDGTDHWELLDADAPTPSGEPAHRPLYLIWPSGGDHSPHSPAGNPHFPPAHDHVVDTPRSGQEFTAEWHVHVVTDADGNFGDVGITSPTVSEIQTAHGNGEIGLIDTEFVFTCPIRPHRDRGAGD